MSDRFKILTINPGSTSTKISFFIGTEEKLSKSVVIPQEIALLSVWDQYDIRKKTIIEFLKNDLSNEKNFDAIVGRGGLFKPVEGGTYIVNEIMIGDAKNNLQGEHISNIGCALAYDIAKDYNCPAFIVDPVSVNEFEPLAFYSGHPDIKRKTLSHALNLHSISRLVAEQMGKDISETNFVVAHLGGGITIAPLRGGKIIDVNDASSDGPFSPERTGGLPLQPFMKLCFSGKMTQQEMKKMISGKGGLVAYLGTNNAKEIEDKIASGDEKAKEVYEAMAYQVCKEIGAMSTVLKGKIDAIILTGGLAKSEMLTNWIKERISFIAKVVIIPGENEMLAMALGAIRILSGSEKSKEY